MKPVASPGAMISPLSSLCVSVTFLMAPSAVVFVKMYRCGRDDVLCACGMQNGELIMCGALLSSGDFDLVVSLFIIFFETVMTESLRSFILTPHGPPPSGSDP